MSGKWERRSLAKRTTRNRTRGNLKRVARLAATAVLVFVVASGLSYAILVFNNLTTSARIFSLDRITFQGLHRADGNHLEQLIRDAFSDNLLTINLFQVRVLLESESWIKSAVVRRKLPDQIEVYVQERLPEAVAAIDGELQVVDREGIALAPFGPGFQFLDRPIVKGMISQEVEGARAWNSQRMEVYLQILDELDRGGQDYSRTISEVDLSEVSQIKVIPERELIPVLLGARDYLQRYETFVSRLDLVQEVKNRHGQIDWIDVTFTNRIIIHTPGGQKQSAVDVVGSD